ncbi:MAG: hypothetical protein ACTSYG_02235 [Candidatus Heimdallarchaeota archaeon]
MDDYNHKTLIGKKFILKYPESETKVTGKVIAIHGQDKSKLIRLRFDSGGMSSYAIHQKIQIIL